jgi:hypothetical protein
MSDPNFCELCGAKKNQPGQPFVLGHLCYKCYEIHAVKLTRRVPTPPDDEAQKRIQLLEGMITGLEAVIKRQTEELQEARKILREQDREIKRLKHTLDVAEKRLKKEGLQ